MEPPKPLEGVLHFHSETGTEGGYWAFQDKRFIFPFDPLPPGTPDGPSGVLKVTVENGEAITKPMLLSELPRERWSYEGLHLLGDGDFLTIYDKSDPQKVLWNGWIRLKQHDLFTEHTDDGFWIHADQIGVDRTVWANWFFEGHPAKLIPAP